MALAMIGLSMRAEVREEAGTMRDPEDSTFFVDLVLVGGGTSVRVVSWPLEDGAYFRSGYLAETMTEDPEKLTRFVAEKLVAMLPVGPSEAP
jgi:hypothetical protein